MYIAIRRYQAKAGAAAHIIERAQTGFVPLIRDLPGFIAYYGVIDANNAVVTVSVFTDQAGEEESTRRAAGWVQANLAEYIEGTPDVVAGEVGWHG